MNRIRQKNIWLISSVAATAVVVSIVLTAVAPLPGDGDIDTASAIYKIKRTTEIILTPESPSVGADEVMHVSGVLKASSGIPNARVSLMVTLPDGTTALPTQGATTRTDGTGRFAMDFTPTVAGDYVFTATYSGKSLYSKSSSSQGVTVIASDEAESNAVRWTWTQCPTSAIIGQSNTYSIKFEVEYTAGNWFGARSTGITYSFTNPDGIVTEVTTMTSDDTTGISSVNFTPTTSGTWVVKCDWDQNNKIYAWDSSPEKSFDVVIPTVTKQKAMMVLNSPTSVQAGSDMTISGTLKVTTGAAIIGAPISLQVVNPDGSVASQVTVATNSDGAFSYAMTPMTAGSYSIKASYAGDANYYGASDAASFSVANPPIVAPSYDYVITNNQVKTPAGAVAYTGDNFTTALQWAVRQAGKVVYVPAGTYTITAEINPASGVTLFGDGPSASGTVLDFVAPHLVVLPGTNGVTLKNFRTTGAGDILIAGPASNILVQDVTAYRIIGGGAAFWTWTSGTGVIDGVKFIRCIADTPNTFGFLLAGDGASDISLRTNGGWTKNIYMEDCQALNCGIYGRPNDFVCGFDLCEQTNVENILVVRCIAINSWMNGFHFEQWPSSINVVLEDCVSSNNGVDRGVGYGYALNQRYTTITFNNCTGVWNKSNLFM